MSHLDQTHEEFSTRSGLVKYSVTGCLFLLIINQDQSYFFAVAETASLTLLKLSESCSFGFQFEGPEGDVPANWVFHTVLFQSDKVAFLLNKWILYTAANQHRSLKLLKLFT